jgi:hypothetical protein
MQSFKQKKARQERRKEREKDRKRERENKANIRINSDDTLIWHLRQGI